MLEVALGIILAVIVISTIDIWFIPLAKLIGALFIIGVVTIFIWFVAILSGG